MKKLCKKCGKVRKSDEYYNSKSTKTGKTNTCKKCITEYRNANKEKQRLYMQNLRDTQPEKVNRLKRKSWANLDPRVKLITQSKNRAKRKNLEHNITVEDLIIPDKCPLLECEFVIGTKNDYQYTHSIDRIDNTKGYVKGNVQIISMKANNMKNSATKEELRIFAKNIRQMMI